MNERYDDSEAHRNIVDSLQSGTVGSLSDSGATTTRLQVRLDVDALPSGLLAGLDGTGQPVLGTDPRRGLVSLLGRGGAGLAVGSTGAVAAEETVVAAKVASTGLGSGAQGEGVGRVVAGGRGVGNLETRD